MSKMIKVKLVHSPCGRMPAQRQTVIGLGLRRLQQEVLIVDSPQSRGMIASIPHLVKIVDQGKTPAK